MVGRVVLANWKMSQVVLSQSKNARGYKKIFNTIKLIKQAVLNFSA
jgi:hypothetical protein